jgi:hypothetical protein
MWQRFINRLVQEVLALRDGLIAGCRRLYP